MHLGGNRRWVPLFVRFKQIWRWRGRHASLTDIELPIDARISEEKLEKYQDLKRELKRIWRCKEALSALWMESTNLRKWLQQVLDVAKEIKLGYRSYATLEQLACGHRRNSGRRFSQPISVKRRDDRKNVCVRRLENSKDPQKSTGHGISHNNKKVVIVMK